MQPARPTVVSTTDKLSPLDERWLLDERTALAACNPYQYAST